MNDINAFIIMNEIVIASDLVHNTNKFFRHLHEMYIHFVNGIFICRFGAMTNMRAWSTGW